MSITPCGGSVPITTGTVVFDASAQTAFVALFPEFTNIPLLALQGLFGLATLQMNNTCQSAVQDANVRQMLLFLLLAHITFLTVGTSPESGAAVAAPALIGRISSATEGSISVATEFAATTTNQLIAYLQQTKYGIQYLAATASFRTMRYVPAPCFPSPFGGYGYGGYNVGYSNFGLGGGSGWDC